MFRVIDVTYQPWQCVVTRFVPPYWLSTASPVCHFSTFGQLHTCQCNVCTHRCQFSRAVQCSGLSWWSSMQSVSTFNDIDAFLHQSLQYRSTHFSARPSMSQLLLPWSIERHLYFWFVSHSSPLCRWVVQETKNASGSTASWSTSASLWVQPRYTWFNERVGSSRSMSFRRIFTSVLICQTSQPSWRRQHGHEWMRFSIHVETLSSWYLCVNRLLILQ